MAELVTPGSDASKERFQWSFQGRIMALDNGASFVSSAGFRTYMDLGSFAVVALDPGGRLAQRTDLQDLTQVQIVAGSTLGNGETVTFFACLDNALSGTLEPLPASLASTRGPGNLGVGPVLARIPIGSQRLDDITSDSTCDWLILDALNDNVAILENASRALADTLLVEVDVPFQPVRAGQSEFGSVCGTMTYNGFRFCCFHGFRMTSRFPTDLDLEKTRSSEMQAGRALFMPTNERLATMSVNQLQKLSFLLHTVYGLPDLAFHVLAQCDADLAKQYLVAEGYLWPVDNDEGEFTLTEAYSPDIWKK